MLATLRASRGALVFAWCGAALFALSLLFFFHAYLIRFGRVAAPGAAVPAIAADTALFTAFALHHSLFARTSLKARVTAVLPVSLERSFYTWTASLLFLAVCLLWRTVPGELYRLSGAAAALGYAVQAAGIVLTVRSSLKLDVLDLAGVRPVLAATRGTAPDRVPLATSGLYGFVRHPLYFAWALFVFGAPHLTMTKLTFAVLSTAYLAIAIPFEERALVDAFGASYRDYQRRVRWRMVPGLY